MSEKKTCNVIREKDCEKLIHWGLRITFFLFAWLYLGIAKADFLYKLQESNYFLFDDLFIKDLIGGKAGIMSLISRFILQFCYYPILGAGIVALLLSSLELATSKVFSIGREWCIVGFIPSTAMLFLFCSVTYELYDSFEVSYGIANIIGLFFSLLTYVIYQKVKQSNVKVFLLIIAIAISAIWIGPCTMVAILLIGADALFAKRFVQGCVMLATGTIATYITAWYSSYHVTPAYMAYSVLHPWPTAYYFTLFIKTIAAHVIVIISLASLQLYKGKQTKSFQAYINAVGGICLLVTVCLGCRYPKALGEEFRLQRLAHEMQWKQMVKEMEDIKVCTKLISAYRAIALIATGQLTEKLFDYNYETYKTDFYKYVEEMVYYPELFLFGSFPQISYRMSMEAITDTQKRLFLIRIMALDAFINEEYELAQKYLNLLKETLFYAKWAEEMEGCLKTPEKYYKDKPYLTEIKEGRPDKDKSGIIISSTLSYDKYSRLPFTTAKKRMMAFLYRRQLDKLELDLANSPLIEQGIPRPIQEGIILKGLLTRDKKTLQKYPIDKKTFEYVRSFIEYYKKHNGEKDLSKKMKEKFGYSYCHYFSFGIGSTTKQEKKNNK